MVIITYKELNLIEYGPIWRVYVAGSSGSGKTSFVKRLLQSSLIKYDRVYYYHPDFYENYPVNWHNELNKEVVYRSDLPTMDSLNEMKPNSVIVLDDIFEQVEKSKVMDSLFRVLSGKYKLHVIVMTQQYFSGGIFCQKIRNCCDYHVIMRNSDHSLTKRIARSLGHTEDITNALRLTEDILYPYIFIDKTQLGRVNKLQVYIDVLSNIKIVVLNGMKYYLISEKDFESSYRKIDGSLAENEITKKTNRITGEGVQTKEASREWDWRVHGESRGERKRTIENHVKRALYKLKKRSKL